jgi:hypothetical protein
MMRRTILVAWTLSLLVCGVVLAEDLRPGGHPEILKPGMGPRRPTFFIWIDKDGWHLRTTAKEVHQFSGVIEVTEGTFTDLKNFAAESRTRRAGGQGDRGHVSEDKLKINFAMRNSGDLDGFDFKVSEGAKSLKFDLKIDKDPANQKFIHIGRNSQNPENNVFEVPVVKAPPEGARKKKR